jgi:hypothetical protein
MRTFLRNPDHVLLMDEDGVHVSVASDDKDNERAAELVRWFLHFKTMAEDLPECAFCGFPILPHEEVTNGAHKDCYEDYGVEFGKQWDIPLPDREENR